MTSHMSTFTPIAEVVPPGELGVAKIEHFEVGQRASDVTSIRAAMGHREEYVPEGRYVRLSIKDHGLMMTDTKMEQRTNLGVVFKAKGDVIIAGLGIGMVLIPLLKKPEVKTITVIEKYQDVVDLVLPAIMEKVPEATTKLKVIVADALEWTPPKGVKYDTIYFDIWPNICTDNLAEVALLKRRFARRKNPGAWMGAWVEKELRYQDRREKREAKRWGRFYR